eukprot:3504460-Alexandrium_andersonii.AAC.1
MFCSQSHGTLQCPDCLLTEHRLSTDGGPAPVPLAGSGTGVRHCLQYSPIAICGTSGWRRCIS